jgi:hypothetical protein
MRVQPAMEVEVRPDAASSPGSPCSPTRESTVGMTSMPGNGSYGELWFFLRQDGSQLVEAFELRHGGFGLDHRVGHPPPVALAYCSPRRTERCRRYLRMMEPYLQPQ